MQKDIFIQNAIAELENQTDIKAEWTTQAPPDIDAIVEIYYNNQPFKVFVEIKKELRAHQLAPLEQLKIKYPHLLVVAEYIYPKLKQELRNEGIGYLETNGNIFLKHGNLFLWLDGQKTNKPEKANAGRAFAKTGLKVLFHFLIYEEWVNLTYREIAAKTGVGFGNINFIMTDLKEQGFLLPIDKRTYKLVNKKMLLDKWMEAYQQKLKPALQVGTFRFVKDDGFLNWKNIQLEANKTWWGGEPAGDILTNYLHPEELTLYTTEKRNELMKNYKLIPDKNGNLKVYQKFWQFDDSNHRIVPPLLVYVDLMNTGDRRCIETAQKIYDGQLQGKF
jgi:hypothetical protein